MSDLDEQIDAAIAAQGQRQDETPSSPILTLLSDLAREGEIAGISKAFIRFKRAHPIPATYVLSQIPAKVVNQYFYRNLELPIGAIQRWQEMNSSWADAMREQIGDVTRFVAHFENIARSIKALDASLVSDSR